PAPGTDAYSPVDGTVVGLGDVVLNGRAYGNRIDIQPAGAPSIVVSVSHLRADPSLVVGAPVTSSGSKLGQVLDFSNAERQALAHYTNDAGNHVLIEIHPAAPFAVRRESPSSPTSPARRDGVRSTRRCRPCGRGPA